MGIMNLRAICPNCGGKIHTQPKGLGHFTWMRSAWLVKTGTACMHCGVGLTGKVSWGNRAVLAEEPTYFVDEEQALNKPDTPKIARALQRDLPISGWYPDPRNLVRSRYWDGAVWTKFVRHRASDLSEDEPSSRWAVPLTGQRSDAG